MLNLDMTSLLAESLLFTSDTDLGYCIFTHANEKFTDANFPNSLASSLLTKLRI